MNHLFNIAAIAIVSSAQFALAFTTISPAKVVTRPIRTQLFDAEIAIDIDEEAQRDIASFEEWASYGGIQRAEGFQLVGEELDGHLDVSVMTTEDMPAGSPVVNIPNEMILSSTKAMEEFGRQTEAEELLKTNGYESEIRQYYLMLKILYELEQGEASPWYQYLNSLPRYYSNGASMTLFCYTCSKFFTSSNEFPGRPTCSNFCFLSFVLVCHAVPPLVAKLCKEERARLNNISVKRPVQFLSNDIKGDVKLWKWAYQGEYLHDYQY